MAFDKNILLRSFIDAIPDGVLSTDLKGRITALNRAATDLLGFNSINLVGKPLQGIVPSFEHVNLERLYEKAKSQGVVRDERLKFYDVKGGLRDLRVSLSMIGKGGDELEGVILVIREVKEEAALEKGLKKLEELSSSLLDHAGAGIVVTDPKGNILFASKSAGSMLGIPTTELEKQNFIKKSKNPVLLNERFNELLKTGKPFEYELESGNKIYLGVFTPYYGKKGSPAGAIAVFNDVSKLIEIDRELRSRNLILKRYAKDLEGLVDITRMLGTWLDTEKVFKIMVEAANNFLNAEVSCFFMHTPGDEKLSLVSALGISEKELEKKVEKTGLYSYLLKLRKPEILTNRSKMPDKKLRSAVLVPVFKKKDLFGILAIFSGNRQIFKKDEIEILQSIGASGAIAAENAILYEELKKFNLELEEKVRERTIELEQSNKLKDLFIDIMGHDLLKPADIARLSTELIMDLEDDKDKKDILKNILDSSTRIIDLIENASVLAKLEAGEKLEFSEKDLADILKSATDDLSGATREKGVNIRVVANGVYPAMVNPLIYDVFANLIGNSIKYGPTSGEVEAAIIDKGLNWGINISDRGSGIPDEHKEAIFDRFKRLEKGGVKGSGLGLAIVKRVVLAHNGKVWVEDNPGGGSIFKVEIPKSQNQASG